MAQAWAKADVETRKRSTRLLGMRISIQPICSLAAKEGPLLLTTTAIGCHRQVAQLHIDLQAQTACAAGVVGGLPPVPEPVSKTDVPEGESSDEL